MTWVILAVFAHFLWAVVNLGDKYVMEKKFSSPVFYTICGLVVGSLVSLSFLPFMRLSWISWIAAAGAVLAGVGFILGSLFYVKAIQIEEASRVNILWVFIPIFDFIFGWLLLGEKLVGTRLLAFGILLSGSLIACVHWRDNHWKFSRAFLLMLASCLFFSSYDVVMRYLTQRAPFAPLYMVAVVSMLCWLVPIMLTKAFRRKYQAEFRKIDWWLFGVVIFIAIVSRLGLLLNTRAISLGPVSLVSALEGFQTIFVFVIAALLTVFVPRIIKEEFDRRNSVLKLMALVLMLGGIATLYL
ncbi:MAG: DMT family transporter [Candidatus Magasanikbacteria bacterium]|nr:DMT family transporter [Candidatus Magasanikbacteria bacterium]